MTLNFPLWRRGIEGEVIVEKPPSDRNYEKPTVRKELC
jgi:hypothetical protein